MEVVFHGAPENVEHRKNSIVKLATDAIELDTKFKIEIQTNILKPSYMKDISDFSDGRYKCRNLGYFFEVCGKVLTGASTLTAFIAGGIPSFEYGGFIAGSLGVMAMTFQHLASFSLNRSKENTEQLNQTLQSLHINTKMPDVIVDDEKTPR